MAMKVLVTGAAGFLGRHLAERLQRAGHEVRAVDLESPVLDELKAAGMDAAPADLRDRAAMDRACAGQEVVYNVAALAAPWGPAELFWAVNVTGTENVIAACKKAKVRRLVHISSPSAVFDGSNHYMADESLPYPKRFLSHYCSTKAASEQRALKANGPALETVCIRPHAMWGPRDRHLLPRIASRARAGRLFQVGDGTNEISTLFVDNAVHGLMLAGQAPPAAGKVYFLTDDEPIRLWDFVRRVLAGLSLPGPRGVIPYPAAYALASAQEAAWKIFRLSGEPLLTRYAAAELAKNHTYSIARAKQDLGYRPLVTLEQGLAKSLAWFEEHGV